MSIKYHPVVGGSRLTPIVVNENRIDISMSNNLYYKRVDSGHIVHFISIQREIISQELPSTGTELYTIVKSMVSKC